MPNQFIIKNNMAEMRAMSSTEISSLQGASSEFSGVLLLGYYEKGDTPTPMIYYLSSTSKPDDGGSVIAVGGIKLEGVFESGVDCKYFGAQKSNVLPENNVIDIFQKWQDYVNTTDGKYFAPTKSANTYYLYKPLYIRKSFICSEDMPTWMYISTAVGKFVDENATTDRGRYDFKVSAVMGINPIVYSDSQDRLRFKNIRILCTNGDNDEIPSQDIGVYFPQGTSFEMDNIIVIRPNLHGFLFKENWMAILKRLNVWGSRNNGFEMIGTFTSLTVENCYVHIFANRGFNVNGATYSVFKSLGVDQGVRGANPADCAYSFASCYGITISGIGSEECKLERLMYLGDVVGTIEDIACYKGSFEKALFQIHTDSNLTISRYKFIDCSQYPGAAPKSFSFMASQEDENGVKKGLNYIVTINADTERVLLNNSNVAVPEYIDPVGKFVYNIINNPYMVEHNVVTALNMQIGPSATPPTTEVKDGMFYLQSDNSRLMFYMEGLWYPVIPTATTSRHGTMNQSAASPDSAVGPGITYSQSEVQAILTELRDLKSKLRSAGILVTG